jgi:hypothetical protein
MDLKLVYGDKLKRLLEKYLLKNEPLAKTGFFIFDKFEENAILFVGLNPSKVKNIEKFSVKYENGIY